VADFHLSYAADPAASSRLGSAVLIAGAQAVEQIDLKVASAVLWALFPVDFRAQRKADRYVVEQPASHSVLAELLPGDCWVPDDLAGGDCSGSAPVHWADFRARLTEVDRCVEVLEGSGSDDSVPVDCLAPADLVLAGCSRPAQVGCRADCRTQLRAGDHFAVVLEPVDFALDGSLRANDCWA
jgi:hypothetical protein